MTVAELIEELGKFPPSMRVVAPGFDELGIEDVDIKPIRVKFQDHESGGTHTEVEEDEDGGEMAILINFGP